MTVCIAAACRNGEYVVSATDGALSLSNETMDTALTKMYWFSDEKSAWQLMYSGHPSNTDLIMEKIRHTLLSDPAALSRERIQRTVRRAFNSYVSEWVAGRVLGAYDMTVEEFKKKGRKIFGDDLATKLAKEMGEVRSSFQDELMVVGWGKTPISVMIYGLHESGPWSGSLAGFGAIGAGRDVAHSALLLYGITRQSSLGDVLYAVAAAKFSAERCDGVGEHTTICISRKQGAGSDAKKSPYEFCTNKEINQLRQAWEQYGRPRIPDEASTITLAIAQRTTGNVGIEAVLKRMRKAQRSSKPIISSTDQT